MTPALEARVFPVGAPHDLAAAMADEPILIDGMKVVFDVKVALYPVSLKNPEPDRTRAYGAGNGA